MFDEPNPKRAREKTYIMIPHVYRPLSAVLCICLFSVQCSYEHPENVVLGEAMRSKIVSFPDGKHLLVAVNTVDGHRIWKTDAEGENAGRIAQSLADVFAPAISPDGLTIAVVGREKRRDAYGLYLLQEDDSISRRLVDKATTPLWPQFSPLGNSIAFSAVNKDGNARIRLLDLKTDTLSDATQGTATDLMPRFSPDGRFIFFWRAATFRHASPVASKTFHDWSLCRIDLQTQETRCIPRDPFYSIVWDAPGISENSFVFAVSLGIEPDLWVGDALQFDKTIPIPYSSMHSAGFNLPTRESMRIANPQWIPGGRSIAFQINVQEKVYLDEPGPAEIYSLDPDSKELRRLSAIGEPIDDFCIPPAGNEVVILTRSGKITTVELPPQPSQ